jgi:hypothetical protein
LYWLSETSWTEHPYSCDVILWNSKKLPMAFKVSKEAGDHGHIFSGQKLLYWHISVHQYIVIVNHLVLILLFRTFLVEFPP